MFIECRCTSEHFIFMISFNPDYEIVSYPETALTCWDDPISEARTQLSCTGSTSTNFLSPLWFLRNSFYPISVSSFSLWPLADPTWSPVCRCGFVECSSVSSSLSVFPLLWRNHLQSLVTTSLLGWLAGWLATGARSQSQPQPYPLMLLPFPFLWMGGMAS